MLKHITIILPIAYRGGSLRVTKTIARMIRAGSMKAGEPCRVRIGVLVGKYDLSSDFGDAIEDGVDIAEFEWARVDQIAVATANSHQGRNVDLPFDEYQMPIAEEAKNFADSDLWLVVSDRTERPLAPIRPYAVFATDYIQRYVPEIFERWGWGIVDVPFLDSVRQANAVITTTPQTLEDAVSYVGVPRKKVHLAPMDFDPTAFPKQAGRSRSRSKGERKYIIWPTNPTQHKNHIRAFDALVQYYERLGGELDVKIVGTNTHFLNPEAEIAEYLLQIPHVKDARQKFEKSAILNEHVQILGEVSDATYAQLVAGAEFMWHPTLYDNGTFAVAEAAWLGTPSLSSGYPQMRYIGERFSIPMEFFNARSAPKMAEALKAMESGAATVRAKLPSREALSKHTWQHYASDYWSMLKGIAA
ncbi:MULTISPECIES: glycosyltransferase family 4 protein [unclassified Mesorhizobium]|uniref:glycosyltransferase family 4 protein n=1 Tax=unclassified Mesorhizobium TaxID=325217 RepID=UPI0011265A50|nr:MULTISPECIES: glycosyltransferase family 4 protein [unclassified Mesorhizobium]TPK42319.1 glycosyltransferase family 4 protein [Mesorhizobium sp. B2-5-2]TPL44486.1 glycosyltransferase family 4 protein [Mesorhizobium sp. B2-4-5]TPM68673.1 glycosyltransferase family 4 protein [Mesorhizobium sp. B2-1-6]TPN71767.1 glycosyltransferase family 4 protein [Mesorhizobium sp. B1-1-2]